MSNITVTSAAGTSYTLSPTPFISISAVPLRNKNAFFGIRYNITLNGTIVSGSPSNDEGLSPSQASLADIITTQKNLTSCFGGDGTNMPKIEITPAGNDSKISFRVRLESINFEEGTYVQTCKYTINLVSEVESSGVDDADITQDLLEDFNETWSFEIDNNHSYADTDGNNPLSARSFIATRTITATGRNFPTRSLTQSATDAQSDVISDQPYDKPAWMQAMAHIQNYANPETTTNVTKITEMLAYDRSRLGTFLDATYNQYNHARTSSVDKGAGTVTVTDTWVLAPASALALENYDLSISSSKDSPYVKVSIQGSVKGLAGAGFSDADYATNALIGSPYGQALAHYKSISNNTQYGDSCSIYKRVSNAVSQTLNSQPLSISLGINERSGEITYNVEFDNRPSNYFTDVMYENISVNDTYPGDVFAVIPVLGRPVGPILQFTFGRTEYRRDITIEMILKHTQLGYDKGRGSLLLTKPSVTDPMATELENLIAMLSPANEPGIRKYFLSPPTESWNPKEGRYTLSLGWTYELSE